MHYLRTVYMANKVKSYDEGEIIKMFDLTRIGGNNASPLMYEWTNTTYYCTKKEGLLQIIAILRKFKEILETRLLG